MGVVKGSVLWVGFGVSSFFMGGLRCCVRVRVIRSGACVFITGGAYAFIMCVLGCWFRGGAVKFGAGSFSVFGVGVVGVGLGVSMRVIVLRVFGIYVMVSVCADA